jgi:predicted transcriptional regulator
MTTITKPKKSQRQSINFNDDFVDGFDNELEELNDAELIERLTLKTPPLPFDELPKKLLDALEEGFCDVDAGRVIPHEEVFRELRALVENN